MLLQFIDYFFLCLIIILAVVFIILKFSGNWKKTAKKVALRYITTRKKYPKYSEKEIFYNVLDARYPDNPATKQLFKEKEKIKQIVEKEINSKSSIFKKYNLPLLIYCCLVIERNSILHKKKNKDIKNLIKEIEKEVKKYGGEKYL